MRPPKPVFSCRPMSIHSSERIRGAAIIISSRNCSDDREVSASDWGCAPTFQIEWRIGIVGSQFLRPENKSRQWRQTKLFQKFIVLRRCLTDCVLDLHELAMSRCEVDF